MQTHICKSGNHLLLVLVCFATPQLSAGFVDVVRARCPVLSSLVVDSCDLSDGGLQLSCDPHGALTRVMVGPCMMVFCMICVLVHIDFFELLLVSAVSW